MHLDPNTFRTSVWRLYLNTFTLELQRVFAKWSQPWDYSADNRGADPGIVHRLSVDSVVILVQIACLEANAGGTTSPRR